MHKKTLIFTDLDGTLLDHYTYQTTEAEDTIKKLKQHDIAIIPNSSKTLPEILLIRKQLDLNSPFIIENGAAVYIPVNYFKKQPEETQLQGDYWVKSFCQDKDHWLSVLATNAMSFKPWFTGFSEMDEQQVARLTGLNIDNASLAKQRQYSEPLDWFGSKQQQTEFISLMQSLGANVLEGGRFLHISGACDKGQAQQWLTAVYEDQLIDNEPAISIALGDGKNDIAMLEQATIAVQIRSPVHEFTHLKRTNNVYQSQQYGPAGWAECLNEILSL
ncbi:HAD-IIB family hydrolase [Psychromonas sp. RZ22]|uniref:HAD-IIB family hydrolase n=1 Tax=Psychromonas algarum TaxID=2555643 RepID=UPI001068051A|nr:HAD-IIB family hydrolase [Psychromonas sp. RZ22]TEW55328.1 HAD-IIB family hydrolase [Psychromonas sp. RZ22]